MGWIGNLTKKEFENKLSIREKNLPPRSRSRLIFDRELCDCLGTMPSECFYFGRTRRYKNLGQFALLSIERNVNSRSLFTLAGSWETAARSGLVCK